MNRRIFMMVSNVLDCKHVFSCLQIDAIFEMWVVYASTFCIHACTFEMWVVYASTFAFMHTKAVAF